ncbi:probable G-protein coupled receptor 139 [Mytilus californianus]|uniref:probable G-protein coupled receptor 139 n=1 Tax=Mytilus californianus TaxID=6549 RepID=UPI002245CE9A|nr:probable G-protein coupled receptor 139 [Mytilus californianus]
MKAVTCMREALYERLLMILKNETNITGCLQLNTFPREDTNNIYKIGRTFFAYFTPIIIIIGVVGNLLSLHVFLSQNLRSLSASTYLAALSVSDLITIIFYVSVEWIRRGLTYLFPATNVKILDVEGLCQFQLYISYASRFVSAWLVVSFTIERYVSICHPLVRRNICTRRSTMKVISGVILVSCTTVLYKPALSGIYTGATGTLYCTSLPQYGLLSFSCDSIYAVFITFVPFVVITILNMLIIRKLMKQRKNEICRQIVTEVSVIRLEFTVIHLALSICFILLNIPYFILWFRNFLLSKYLFNSVVSSSAVNLKYWQGVLYFVRTIFYMNYCINVFLYLTLGAYFRHEVRALLTFKRFRRKYFVFPVTVQTDSYQTRL